MSNKLKSNMDEINNTKNNLYKALEDLSVLSDVVYCEDNSFIVQKKCSSTYKESLSAVKNYKKISKRDADIIKSLGEDFTDIDVSFKKKYYC